MLFYIKKTNFFFYLPAHVISIFQSVMALTMWLYTDTSMAAPAEGAAAKTASAEEQMLFQSRIAGHRPALVHVHATHDTNSINSFTVRGGYNLI